MRTVAILADFAKDPLHKFGCSKYANEAMVAVTLVMKDAGKTNGGNDLTVMTTVCMVFTVAV